MLSPDSYCYAQPAQDKQCVSRSPVQFQICCNLLDCGMSLKLMGWPVMGLITSGFLTFQARPFSGAAMRIAWWTLSSGVSVTLNALPASTTQHLLSEESIEN